MIDLSKHSVGDKFITNNGWMAELLKKPRDKQNGIYPMQITHYDRPIFETRIMAKYTRYGEIIPIHKEFSLMEELKK